MIDSSPKIHQNEYILSEGHISLHKIGEKLRNAPLDGQI